MKTNVPVICLVTDTCWPATGGVEAWVHAYSVHLGKTFTVFSVAHANTNSLGGVLSRTVLLKAFNTFEDDAGNTAFCLAPSLFGRVAMLPFILWNFPLVKRLWPKPVFDFLYYFYKIAFFKKLSAAIAAADIVHCFSTGHLAACVTDVCAKRGLRLIHSPPVHFGRWGDSPLLLSAYSRANAVLCLSQAFKTEFEKRTRGTRRPIFVVPALTISNVPGRAPAKAPSPPFVFFLGRRERHKGLDRLIAAFETCQAKASLVVAGPGGRTPEPSSGIVDLGEVDEQEKQWLLENCSVVCVPSSDESFGIVYTEAMRCAKPVIGLDVAPVNELVVNGETGILVSPLDRASLSKALADLLGNDQRRQTMGRNGLRRYEKLYAPAVVLKRIIAAYEGVLHQPCRPDLFPFPSVREHRLFVR